MPRMKLVIVAFLKALSIMAVMYTLAVPHIYMFLSQLPSTQLEKDEASLSLSTTATTSIINASSTPSPYISMKHEEESSANADVTFENWNRIQEEAKLQLQNSPTFRIFQEYTNTITESIHHLKDLSFQLEKTQQDVLQRLNRIQVQGNKVLLEQQRFVETPDSIPTLLQPHSNEAASLDRNSLVQILATYTSMTQEELQVAINTTMHQWTNMELGLVHGTFKTRDLYRQFSHVDSFFSSLATSAMVVDVEDTTTTCTPQPDQNFNTVEYVRIVDVWEAVGQIQDIFYQQLARRIHKSDTHIINDTVPWSKKITGLGDGQRNWNDDSKSSQDHLIQHKDWESMINKITLGMNQVLEDSHLQQSLSKQANRIYGRWKRIVGILQKKYKHSLLSSSSSNHEKTNELSIDKEKYCCTRNELDRMLNDAFLSLAKDQDIHTSLVRSIENIKADKGFVLSERGTQTQLFPSPSTLNHQNTRVIPSKQMTWRDILNGSMWPKMGQGLDFFVDSITGYNPQVDSFVAYLSGDQRQGQTMSQSLGQSIALKLNRINIPPQFETMKDRSGILYRGEL